MNEESIYAFAPCAARASYLDQRVRDHLAASLRTIFVSIEGLVPFTPADADRLVSSVRSGPVPPVLFALYGDLVLAAFDEDFVLAQRLLEQILGLECATGSDTRVVTLDDADLGTANAERYRQMVDEDADIALAIGPVSAAERVRFTALFGDALALLQRAAPELCDELKVLVREVVLIDSHAEPGDTAALVFDGASSFFLWGGLFINSARQTDRVTLATALTHEAAHSHLFGISLGGPLVTNDPAEVYASPLRYDPRPMDGLVHATYVLARMAYCLERLLQSGCLSAEEADRATVTLTKYRQDYQAGLDVVAAHARFTPEGAGAFDSARQYMATAHQRAGYSSRTRSRQTTSFP